MKYNELKSEERHLIANDLKIEMIVKKNKTFRSAEVRYVLQDLNPNVKNGDISPHMRAKASEALLKSRRKKRR